MYNGVTEAFKTKLAEPSRTFHARLINTANSGEVISDGFFSVKSYGQSNENNETLSLGGTVATYIEVELYHPAYIVTGKEYEYQIGLLLDDGTLEYVPIGLFTAQKPKDDDGKVTFTAYDRFVSKLGYIFSSELTYPIDGKAILDEIQIKSGVSIANINSLPNGIIIPKRASVSEADDNGNTTTTYVNPFDGFSYRETIGYLALMYGKFATVNRNGAIEFRWYTDNGHRVESNMSYNDVACAETSFEVKYVYCTIGDDSSKSLTSGSGATGISANAPVMTQALLDSIYGKVGGMKYLPTTLTYKGDPRLDLGDIITVVKRDGTEVKVPVMSLNLDYDGGLINEVGSYGDTEQSSQANDVGPTTKRMDRVYSDLLLVKELVASKASIAYLQANYANITDLDAATARIGSLESNQITTGYLQANFAKLDLSNIMTGSITNAMLGTAVVDTANLKDASITDAKIVELTANKITAGTLSVERLELVGSTSSLVYALNNAGQLVSTTVDTLDGDTLTPRSITADKLVANAITANEIASKTITATQVNLIDLFAQDITATGTITGLKLKSAYIESTSGLIGGFNIGTNSLYKGTNAIGINGGAYFGNDGLSISDLFKVTPSNGIYLTNIGKTYSVSLGSNGMRIQNISDGNSYTQVNHQALGSSYYNSAGANADTSLYITHTDGSATTSAYLALSGSYTYISMSGENQCMITMGNAGSTDLTYQNSTLRIRAPYINLNGLNTTIGSYGNNSYELSTGSFICGSWIRTVGDCGWYNETYGGGWWMRDGFIRNFGSKAVALDNYLAITNNDIFTSTAHGLRHDSTGAWLVRMNDATNYTNLVSVGNTTYNVSIYTPGNVWKNGSTSTYFATTSTSDRRLKEFVSDMSIYEGVFMELQAIAFKYHDGLYNAQGKAPLTQWGFYAQDTIKAFEKYGISWSEQELVVIEDGELTAEEKKYVAHDMLKMNYQNLIALDTHMIQKTILRVDDHDWKIREVQNQLYSLQFAFAQLQRDYEQLEQNYEHLKQAVA